MERIVKTQIGISHSADFEENTWTFEMPKGFEVIAGDFVIVPKEKYDELIKKFNQQNK